MLGKCLCTIYQPELGIEPRTLHIFVLRPNLKYVKGLLLSWCSGKQVELRIELRTPAAKQILQVLELTS